jgi:sialate O-acetylesterase
VRTPTNRRRPRFIAAFAAVLLIPVTLAAPLRAEVRLPAIVSDNMAIQSNAQARIWGWADPGEEVTVTLGVTSLPKVKADDGGRWIVALPAQKPGKVSDITVVGASGGAPLTIKNIIAGEVWLCSGQSNMEFHVWELPTAKDVAAKANDPSIRLFTVPRKSEQTPANDCRGQWVECSPEAVSNFTAVGYFFGRELRSQLDVPIGLIHSAYGGTPAEAWTSNEALSSDPEFAPILDRAAKYPIEYPGMLEKYDRDYKKWEATTQEAIAHGANPATTQPAPRPPPNPDKNSNLASVLFNGMIHPIVPYTIRGAIWYQGETNGDRGYQYRKLLPTMIADWRKQWGEGDFPFGIVQLANWGRGGSWEELREAQAMTAANVPACGLAVTIDIGDTEDIHPKNKQEVGHRLALWALASVYGKEIEFSGPVYDSMKIEGSSIRISFKHATDGLKVKGDEPLKGFTIAGEDQKFVTADAKIDGSTVVVHSDDVSKPVAVRYAWAPDPPCNLYNNSDLPAVPFRTDEWPGKTINAK